jgi:hypothetical protein
MTPVHDTGVKPVRGPRSLAKLKKTMAQLNQTAPESTNNSEHLPAKKSLILEEQEDSEPKVKTSEQLETDVS